MSHYLTTKINASALEEEIAGVPPNFVAPIKPEVVMTFMFLIIILGATHKNASPDFAGMAIGLALTLIHLVSIPVTNTSVIPREAQ